MKNILDILNVGGDAVVSTSGCSGRRTRCSGDGCC